MMAESRKVRAWKPVEACSRANGSMRYALLWCHLAENMLIDEDRTEGRFERGRKGGESETPHGGHRRALI